jgi:hypothetical protein
MRRLTAILPIAFCAATACATAGTGSARLQGAEGSVLASRQPIALATRTLIPTRTLDLDPGLNLYDVVSRYWPQVLRPVAPIPGSVQSMDPRGDIVGVYVDDMFTGGQEQLKTIRSSAVSSIRRLTPGEEYIKWGRSHPGGALLLTLR